MRQALFSALVALLCLVSPPTPGFAQASDRLLVVIDAGHGGVDPGAKGSAGTLEKDVALAVALELEAMLIANGRYDVRLTRRDDTLIPLRERTRLANLWRQQAGSSPALFVSIHTNAHERRSARGFETFFLAEALTEDAVRVAAMENDARRFEDPVSDDPLAFILTDLRQNQYLHESSDGAALFQRRMGAIHPGPDRGVKQAGFVVLEGAFMPAVLIELGFISNTDEERMLASSGFQRNVAAQLALAVEDFFTRSRRGVMSARP